jgi:hypothetical protein
MIRDTCGSVTFPPDEAHWVNYVIESTAPHSRHDVRVSGAPHGDDTGASTGAQPPVVACSLRIAKQ